MIEIVFHLLLITALCSVVGFGIGAAGVLLINYVEHRWRR